MVLTEYYEELVLKYFISVIGEFKNGDFGFHVFVPFINLPRNPKAALGSKVFVYMKNGQFVYMWYSFNLFKPFRKLTWHHAAAPKWSWRQHSHHNRSRTRRPLCKRYLLD